MRALGLPFNIHTADIDETPHPQESPSALVCRLSREKAHAVAKNHPQALIIAADTIVVLNGEILGKPTSPAHAKEMLIRLRDQKHSVYSAVTLTGPKDTVEYTVLNQSIVSMRPYTNAQIDAYIATGDPMDKAGAYAIQHPNFAPVARLNGCYASVMGLPLADLADALAVYGIVIESVGQRCAAVTGQTCCVTP
jgi:MAF protein